MNDGVDGMSQEAVFQDKACFAQRLWGKVKNIFERERNFLLLIFFFSLLVRIYVRVMELCISRDGCQYVMLARIWIQGQFQDVLEAYPIGCPPFLLFLMVALNYFGISPVVSGVGLNILAGALCPCLIYAISREIFPRARKIAAFAAVLTAVNPSLIFLSIEPQRDMIYLFFCGCVFWFILIALRKDRLYLWGLAGCASAFASLTRFEAFELLPLVLFVLFFCSVRKVIPLKKSLLRGVIFLLSFFLVNIIFFSFTGSFDIILVFYKNFMQWRWDVLSEELM